MNEIRFGFRIVHIDNIPHINSVGFVLPDSELASQTYIPIGDDTVIEKRKTDITDIDITQYIPFYLGPRSIMLYVIQNGFNGVKQHPPENIVYCVIKIELLIRDNVQCMFTDGHALSRITNFYNQNDLHRLNDIVSYKDVYSHYWNKVDDIDLKRRRESELLIKESLSKDYICGYVVYNEYAKSKLIGYGVEENKIIIRPNYYF